MRFFDAEDGRSARFTFTRFTTDVLWTAGTLEVASRFFSEVDPGYDQRLRANFIRPASPEVLLQGILNDLIPPEEPEEV